MTLFFSKIEILGELYLTNKDNEALADFIQSNDLGLPLAYLASEGLCEVSAEGERYIEETWNNLLSAFAIKDDKFDSLDDVLLASKLRK